MPGVQAYGEVRSMLLKKVAVWTQIIAPASHLARADHVEVPSSVQMMGFTG
jgi:hypothetical protein